MASTKSIKQHIKLLLQRKKQQPVRHQNPAFQENSPLLYYIWSQLTNHIKDENFKDFKFVIKFAGKLANRGYELKDLEVKDAYETKVP